MKKFFLVLISVVLLNFVGCGGSSEEAKALQKHNLKLVGIPQEIVVNICQDKNNNGSCDEGEFQAKVRVNANDSIAQMWEKVKFEADGRYILENYDETLNIIMEIDGSKVAKYNNVDLSLTYKPTTKELSVLQAVVDADFLKEEDVAKLKALDNRKEIDRVLFNSLTKNQSLLEEQNLTKETALIINLEEIAKGLIDSNVSKELPEQLEACANNNTCIEELVNNTSDEVELTEEEAVELARSKNVADGYIVKLNKPVVAVCSNGKEYNSSLTVGEKGKIDFEAFPVGTECNLTVPKGAIIDSNNNGTFDSDDKPLEFEMVGSADDTFISPLTTLLFKKRVNGEDVGKFALMIQNFDPVVAPKRVTTNTGIEKLEIEKLVILMEILKTSMKQSADITKLDLSGIVNTKKTDTIKSLNIDALIAQFSTEIKNSVKEKALSIRALVEKLQTLNPSKVDINSFFVSVSDGGKSINDAIKSSLLVSLPDGVDPLEFIGTPTSVIENKAPIAKAGADQNVTEGTTITLNASKSSDSDGEIKSYTWKEGEKVLGTTSLVKVSDFSVGVHMITLTVKDNKGKKSSDTVVCTVNKKQIIIENKAPVANAGADINVTEGTEVTLDGSKSSDSDGEIKSYTWTVFKNNEFVFLSDKIKFTLSDLAVGGHNYGLRVTDNKGKSSTDSVTINVVKKTIPVASDKQFIFPSDFYSNFKIDKNSDKTRYEIEHFGLTSDKSFFYYEEFFKDNSFVLDEENSRTEYILLEGTWEEESSSENSVLSENDTIVVINNLHKLTVKSVEDVSGQELKIEKSEQIVIMPEGSKITIFNHEILNDRYKLHKPQYTHGNTENTYYSSLSELMKFQCGTHYMKEAPSESGVKGISFTCGEENQTSGTLIGVKSDNTFVDNVGSWKKIKLENSDINALILTVNESYRKYEDNSLFSIKDDVVWEGNYDKKGYSDELKGYNKVVLNSFVSKIGELIQLEYNKPKVFIKLSGSDRVKYGTTIEFSITSNYTDEGSVISYEWKEGNTTLSTEANFSKNDFQAGVHTITLTIVDDKNITSRTSIDVTVEGKLSFSGDTIESNDTKKLISWHIEDAYISINNQSNMKIVEELDYQFFQKRYSSGVREQNNTTSFGVGAIYPSTQPTYSNRLDKNEDNIYEFRLEATDVQTGEVISRVFRYELIPHYIQFNISDYGHYDDNANYIYIDSNNSAFIPENASIGGEVLNREGYNYLTLQQGSDVTITSATLEGTGAEDFIFENGKIKVAQTLDRTKQDIYNLELVIEDSTGAVTQDRVVIFVQEKKPTLAFNKTENNQTKKLISWHIEDAYISINNQSNMKIVEELDYQFFQKRYSSGVREQNNTTSFGVGAIYPSTQPTYSNQLDKNEDNIYEFRLEATDVQTGEVISRVFRYELIPHYIQFNISDYGHYDDNANYIYIDSNNSAFIPENASIGGEVLNRDGYNYLTLQQGSDVTITSATLEGTGAEDFTFEDGKIKVAEVLDRTRQDVYELELIIEDSTGVITHDRVVIHVTKPRENNNFN